MLVPGDHPPDVDALLAELEEADGAVRALYRELAADPDRAGEYEPRLKHPHAAIAPKALAQAMRRIAYPVALARHLVEEAPAAYREITEVLEDQEDLVRRRVRLEPIAVLKGYGIHMTGWNRGFDLPPGLAARIAKLRAAAMFDIYAYDDDEEDGAGKP